MWRTSKVLYVIGTVVVVAGALRLASPPEDVSYTGDGPEVAAAAERQPDYLGWGTLLLGFLVLGSSHYFKLREARRSDRQEQREIHDRRQRGDDVH